MVQVMTNFLAGLFVGAGKLEAIKDHLDLERWFRVPKSHERRIHDHRHAGVRIVLEGPTLVHALDAYHAHPKPFTAADLLPVSNGPRPAKTDPSVATPQGHEEGTIQEDAAVTLGRPGEARSRITEFLALSRALEKHTAVAINSLISAEELGTLQGTSIRIAWIFLSRTTITAWTNHGEMLA